MKTLSVTMEDALYMDLKALVCLGQISHFVSEAVKRHMDSKKAELAAQYIEAELDEERVADINLWRGIDAEGWQ